MYCVEFPLRSLPLERRSCQANCDAAGSAGFRRRRTESAVTLIKSRALLQCGKQSKHGVHGEDGQEWINWMPVTQSSMRNVVGNRKQKHAHGKRQGVQKICTQNEDQPGE